MVLPYSEGSFSPIVELQQIEISGHTCFFISMTNPNPTPSQTDFEQLGYVQFNGFAAERQLNDLENELSEFIRNVVPEMPPEKVFYENKNDPGSLKQIQNLFDFSPFFQSLMFDSPYERLAKQLLGTEVVGINMQYFNKPPAISKPTPPHQDGYYFMLEPNHALTMWLALDETDEENGCVRYVPGSNRNGLRNHAQTQVLGFSQGITDYGSTDHEQELALHLMPGDLLAHHSMTVHRADGNRSSTRQRRAIGFIYYSADAVESPEKKNQGTKLV